MRPQPRDYEQDLIEKLKKKPKFATEYLNAALEDDDGGAEERFLIALRHVAQAHGMAHVAEKAGLTRQAIYKTLSNEGNPELATLKALLDAMGFRLAIEPKKIAI